MVHSVVFCYKYVILENDLLEGLIFHLSVLNSQHKRLRRDSCVIVLICGKILQQMLKHAFMMCDMES